MMYIHILDITSRRLLSRHDGGVARRTTRPVVRSFVCLFSKGQVSFIGESDRGVVRGHLVVVVVVVVPRALTRMDATTTLDY